jgi:hypothetical protein
MDRYMCEKCATIWICLWLTLGLIAAISICFYGSSFKTNHIIKYDCRLAEISVDYPDQVKTQCRNLK